MSKHEGSTYCDYIRCHLVIAPKDRSQLNYGQFDYHGGCFIAENREKQDATRRPSCATSNAAFGSLRSA